MTSTVTLTFAGTALADRIIAQAPLGFWRLDEASGASTVVDSSGNGYDATPYNVTFDGDTGPDGRSAATFNGTSSYIDLDDAGLLAAASGAELTLLMWIKPDSWSETDTRMSARFTADLDNSFLIRRNGANTLSWFSKSGGTTKEITKSSLSPTDWVCVVLTVSETADEVKAYYNGELVDTLTGLGTFAGAITAAEIGSNTLGSAFWDGGIALVALWDSALDVTTIADLANATPGYYADITSYVEMAQGAIGFFDQESHFAQIGTCQVTLNNDDRRFSPAYSSGPFFGYNWINGKIVITNGAYTLFTGFVQRVEPQAGVGRRKRATLFCEDMLGWLSRTRISLPLQQSRQMAYLLKLIGSEVFKTDFAQGTITFTANVDKDSTITIGSTIYTFKETVTNAYDVLIGATKEDTAINLAAAVNDDESVTGAYGTNTLRSPEVSAEADDSGVVTVTALARGTAGNAFVLSTAAPHHDANSFTDTQGTGFTGTLEDTYSQNGVYLVLAEAGGTPGFDCQLDYTGITGTGNTFTLYGRYDGSALHTVNVNAWNGSTWDTLGTLVSSGTDAANVYTLDPTHTIAGVVLIQIVHTTSGNAAHNLYIDHAFVTATMAGAIDGITLSGATLSGGTDGPTDFNYQDGIQEFDIAADGWSEERTNALQAFMDVVNSEFGYGWCDRDGTLRTWDRNEEFKVPAATPDITLDNTHFDQTGEMGSAIYNSSTVTYEPRGEVSDQIVAKANNVIKVPGSSTGVRWNRLKKLYEAGALDTLDAGVVTVRLPFAQSEVGGTIIGATEVIMPKRGDDYQINDQADGSGFNYTNTLPPRIVVSAVITGSGIECTFSNSALGDLYIIDFQVRGTAIIAYDRQQVIREDSDSIAAYGKRTKSYHLPLASNVIFAESLGHHLISRHKDPRFRVQVASIHDALTAIGGGDPLSIDIGDIASVTDDQTGVSAQKHIVRGIRFAVGAGGRALSLEWHLKAALDQTYWILGDSTYGVLGSTTRLAI